MKLKYKVYAHSGTFGGRSFVVQAHIQLNDGEASVRSAHSVYESIVVGEKFADIKGVSALGSIHLGDLLGQPKEYKFPTIQMAGDFVDLLQVGIHKVKGQIEATRVQMENLNKEFEVEI
ncbi:MAG TPA: hypothetical protein VJ750_02910 [Rhizomicrobium sp.]|nr:hypothetical protein [Rhizomicrobium sp.]